ncbi:hypothetical protein ONZ51_g54 [Trametes cubensis]|uniref:ADF-H domain-containing protein n=1 Tax=Trametes cubensis TaxID=1111947 RepID=A0AAD7U4M3_9APHY|nr:hypothetical protein ONZ51_g54 [Trametes cubensis]
MADLSDPKIDEAYQDVRSDKTDTNWLLLDYEVCAVRRACPPVSRYRAHMPSSPSVNLRPPDPLADPDTHSAAQHVCCLFDTFAWNAGQSDRSDKLQLTSTGSGGLAELREQLDDGKASYAYVRVQYANDKESKREKFILVIWIGPNCKVMRKAKISVHTADVKSVLRVYSMEVPAREKDDLKEEPIIVKLRKAGGASYDGV